MPNVKSYADCLLQWQCSNGDLKCLKPQWKYMQYDCYIGKKLGITKCTSSAGSAKVKVCHIHKTNFYVNLIEVVHKTRSCIPCPKYTYNIFYMQIYNTQDKQIYCMTNIPWAIQNIDPVNLCCNNERINTTAIKVKYYIKQVK